MIYRDRYSLTRSIDEITRATRSSRPVIASSSSQLAAATRSSRSLVTSASDQLAAATRSSRSLASAVNPCKELFAATSAYKDLTAATRLDDEIAAVTRSSRELDSIARLDREIKAATRPFREIEAATRVDREIEAATRPYREIEAATKDLTSPVAAAKELALPHELSLLSRVDREVQGALAELRWTRLANEVVPTAEALATSYRNLSLPPLEARSLFALDSLPTLELFAHTSLLNELGFLEAAAPAVVDPEEADEAAIQEELDRRSQATLESLLASYDPALLPVWHGANEGLTNQNDSIRHFCVSQRALLQKLLEKAAPNKAVMEWSDNPDYIGQRDTNVPTMSGRLAYLCDRAKLSRFTHFAITDAKAAYKVWNQLTKGVKQMPGGMDERSLTALRVRSNCLIVMALQLIREGLPN